MARISARLDSIGLGAADYDRETGPLRVLIANERKDCLALVAPIVIGLGHEVIAREIGCRGRRSRDRT